MQQRFFAQNGRPGSGRQKDGPRGQDIIIEVPPGTLIHDAESNELLADLTERDARRVLFEGGRGGKGNTHFKSSRHQTPRFSQPGEPGVERRLRVELQIIADIGFVGLPNAGKSTLLKVLTAADPKIGNYPFTTVIPNLGVMHHFERDVVLADIPGIIEGASTGAGLGLRFLRHIARTRGLAYVVDCGDADPVASVELLKRELRTYSHELAQRSHVVVLTKTDLVTSGEVTREHLARAEREFADGDGCHGVISVSAMSSVNLDGLRSALFDLATPSEFGEDGVDDPVVRAEE